MEGAAVMDAAKSRDKVVPVGGLALAVILIYLRRSLRDDYTKLTMELFRKRTSMIDSPAQRRRQNTSNTPPRAYSQFRRKPKLGTPVMGANLVTAKFAGNNSEENLRPSLKPRVNSKEKDVADLVQNDINMRMGQKKTEPATAEVDESSTPSRQA